MLNIIIKPSQLHYFRFWFMQNYSRIFFIFFSAVFISLSGCASVDRGTPVPIHLTNTAQIPGYNDIRYSVDNKEQLFTQQFVNAIKSGLTKSNEVAVLAISGGGSDGAFGAGLLCGWTTHGSRPVFQVVTGVSTGSLISTFAFLGNKYDGPLKEMYTTLHDDNIFAYRSIFDMITGDSLATTAPLYRTISRYIDQSVLAAVAREHAKGRRLLVVTTNLDSSRAVAWNMGAIAASGHPGALDLYRRIIITSASIPVLFPPQYIKVEANGEKYTEMHVDGGVMEQVFLHLPPIEKTLLKVKEQKLTAYVIRNSKVTGEYSAMSPTIIPILTRMLDTLVQTQGVGDLYEIYEQSQKGGSEFQLAHVPDDLKTDHHDMFDPIEMKRVFEAAFQMASKGYPWKNQPPEVL